MSKPLHKTTDDQEQDDWVSKSEKKRQAEDMQVIARALMKLSENQRKKVPMSDELRDAIVLAIKIKNTKEGFRRQMQLLAKILRNNDVEDIKKAMNEFDLRHKRSDVEAMKLEVIRDAMLKKGDAPVSEFIKEHPTAERQKLRQLVRQANKEAKLEKPAKASKELFQYLKEIKSASKED